MNEQHTPTARASIVITLAALTLSACTNSEVDRVLAEGGEAFPEDFVDKTFPVYFAVGEQTDGGSEAEAGIGSARFISADEIEYSGLGQPTRVYTRVGTTNEFAPDDGSISLFVEELGAAILASSNLDFAGPTGGVAAYSGFETPVANRPALASYNSGDFAVLFLAGPDFPEVDTLTCSNCVDLSANFAAGDISGQVFDGTSTDASGEFSITNELVDGTITSSGFTGQIEATAAFTPVGGSTRGVTTELTNQNVIGRFFGSDADQAMVVYEGDFAFGEGADRVTGTYSGASDAFDSGDSGPVLLAE